MSAPLYEHLIGYTAKNRISFAMPGHKNGRGLRNDILSVDVTELPVTENLHNPGKYVTEAKRLLSKLYGSEESYILIGGSTAAIQAMICSAVKCGGTLLSAADCHISVINTCALLGINLKIFPKNIIDGFSVPDRTGTLKGYLTDDVDAVIITSPNYYGICSDIKTIAKECHEKNIPLLVDEAHAAHFVADDSFPETAVKYADAVCQSAHKTLNAMNGAAYLHVNGLRIDRNRLEKALRMFQSTSPSYPVAVSADLAREEIENGKHWEKTYNMCMSFKKKIGDTKILILNNDDATRIVLNFSEYGITGFDVEKKLSEHGIDIEMADLNNIVLIVTPSNTQADMDILSKELIEIIDKSTGTLKKKKIQPPPVFDGKIFPQKAFYAKQRDTKIGNAAGKCSCSTVVAYPPGIPIIYMGETIRTEQIEYIKYIEKNGAEITGLADGKIAVAEWENE